MNTIHRVSLRGVFAALFALVLGASAFAAAPLEGPGQHWASVAAPAGLTANDVQEAIVATLYGRAWAVQEKADGKVVGYLKHRSNEALVTLTYDATKVDISCVGYEINKRSGERKKPELPAGWLNNIKSDLTKKLNQRTALK